MRVVWAAVLVLLAIFAVSHVRGQYTCVPGIYCQRAGNILDCYNCVAGSYCPGTNCTIFPCPTGSWSAANAHNCSSCPAGRFNAQTGQTSSGSCIACPAGTYGSAPRQSACVNCAAGKYNGLTGQTSASACLNCSASTFNPYPGGSSQLSCSACSVGAFCPSSGLAKPVPCPVSHYCPSASMTSPLLCQQGFYCPSSGLSVGVSCPQGHFCPTNGLSAPGPNWCVATAEALCLLTVCACACSTVGCQCPQGSVTPVNCKYTCTPGYAPTPLGCVPCEPGHYSNGQLACTLCAQNTYTNVNATAQCILCADPGLYCNPATGLASPRPGYWSYSDPGDRSGAVHTVLCYRPELCLGPESPLPSQTGETLCPPTRLQSSDNIECAECTAGASEWNGNCVPCDSVNGGMVLLLMLLSWLYVLFTHKVSQKPSSLTSVFLYFVQIALVIAGTAAFDPSVAWLNVFAIHPENSGGPCIGPISPIGKFGLSLAMNFIFLTELALTMLLHAFLSRWPLPFLNSDHTSFRAASYARTFLALLLYSFTSLTTTTISFLDCINVGAARVVAFAPAVHCDSDSYRSLYPLVALILALTLALPLSIAVLLFARRADVRAEKAAERFHSWSILFDVYKPSTFFWHVVVLVRRLLLVLCTTVHEPRNRGLAFGGVTLACIALHYRAKPYLDRASNRLEFVSLTVHAFLAMLLIDFPDPSTVSGGSQALFLLIGLPAVLFLACVVFINIRSRLFPTSSATNSNDLSPVSRHASSSRVKEVQVELPGAGTDAAV